MFNLIKKENGNVLVAGVGQNYILPQECKVARLGDTQYIEISQEGRVIFGFDYSQLEFYKIDPDPTLYPKFQDIDLFIAGVLAVDFFKPNAVDAGAILGDFYIDPSAESSAAIIATPTATLTFTDITKVSILRIVPTLNCILQGIDSTGITKQQIWYMINDSAFSITMPEENVNPAPNDRFVMSGTSQTLPAGGALPIMYDLSVNRFRLMVKS
jgi:hypothetical protein